MNILHHCTLATSLICIVLALTTPSIAHGKDETMLDFVNRTPTYNHFTMGLYIASSQRVVDVTLSKVSRPDGWSFHAIASMDRTIML